MKMYSMYVTSSRNKQKTSLGRREDPFYDVPLQTVEVTLDLK